MYLSSCTLIITTKAVIHQQIIYKCVVAFRNLTIEVKDLKGSVLFWRCMFFFIGIIIVSLGIALTVKAPIIGVGSWDVLHIGLSNTVGLSIGTWSILLGFIILSIDSVIMKRLPKIGTIFDMVITGILIDIFLHLLPDATTVTAQVLTFIVGFLLLAFGCGMYIIGNIGVGPRDTFMLLIVNKVGWSVQKTRTIIEVTVALVGLILGGPLGIGTVIMAFALGPIVQWSMKFNEKIFFNITGVKDTMYS